MAELSGEGELIWTEPAPPRFGRRDTHARALDGESEALDKAYREARALARERTSRVWVVVDNDGKIVSATHTEMRRRQRLITLSISGVSHDDARRWAQHRLGASGWRSNGDKGEIAILSV